MDDANKDEKSISPLEIRRLEGLLVESCVELSKSRQELHKALRSEGVDQDDLRKLLKKTADSQRLLVFIESEIKKFKKE